VVVVLTTVLGEGRGRVIASVEVGIAAVGGGDGVIAHRQGRDSAAGGVATG